MTENADPGLGRSAPGARRADGAERPSASAPNPEVVARARRRQFSSAERRRILEAADRCTQPGEIGALLRREGIYSSLLSTWRKQRSRAQRDALAAQHRGPKPQAGLAEKRHGDALTRENLRLREQLDRAQTIIEIQKKLCALLGLPTAPASDENIR